MLRGKPLAQTAKANLPSPLTPEYRLSLTCRYACNGFILSQERTIDERELARTPTLTAQSWTRWGKVSAPKLSSVTSFIAYLRVEQSGDSAPARGRRPYTLSDQGRWRQAADLFESFHYSRNSCDRSIRDISGACGSLPDQGCPTCARFLVLHQRRFLRRWGTKTRAWRD